MTDRLQGKTALVTAAAQGIGRAIAEAFVGRRRDASCATDLDREKLAAWRRRRAISASSTCSRPRRVEALAAEDRAAVDVLFNCAGFVHHGTVARLLATKDWDFSFDLNVKSMHRTIRAFLPGMLEHGRRLDRQHRLGRLLGARHPEPLRLWRHARRR